MSNRTDFTNLVCELSTMYGLSTNACARIETELHNAYVAGCEGVPCKCQWCRNAMARGESTPWLAPSETRGGILNTPDAIVLLADWIERLVWSEPGNPVNSRVHAVVMDMIRTKKALVAMLAPAEKAETMVAPIRPEDVHLARKIPDDVIRVFNELIAKRWDGYRAHIAQSVVIDMICRQIPDVTSEKISAERWLDVEGLYRAAGWVVDYDKRDYNAPGGDSYFTFKKRA